MSGRQLIKFLKEVQNEQDVIITAPKTYGIVIEECRFGNNKIEVCVVFFDEYNQTHVKHIQFILNKPIPEQIYEFFKWLSSETELNFTKLDELVKEYYGEDGFERSIKKLQIELLIKKFCK